MKLKAPFPYFGGKSKAAALVWERFGNVPNFCEPFFGSGAVLLSRPHTPGTETVNDKDGLLANFWRALQAEPDTVAEWADWPVNENDLHARHAWLVARKDTLQERLEGDPDYFDAKIAGWWVWGMAAWIGSGFCSGNGPWQVVEAEDGSRKLVHLGNAGQGVNRQLEDLVTYFRQLADRLRGVRVCCGDWSRVCGGKDGKALRCLFASGQTCGIFLDPPYSAEAGRDATLYRQEDLVVAHTVREWAIAHGDDQRLRIALCGYEGEYAMPDGWEEVWSKAGQGGSGYGGQNKSGYANKGRERIWFSPGCLQATLFDKVTA